MQLGQWAKGLRGKMLLIVAIPAFIGIFVCYVSLAKFAEVDSLLVKQTERIQWATNDGIVTTAKSDSVIYLLQALDTHKAERSTNILNAQKQFDIAVETATSKYLGIQTPIVTQATLDVRDSLIKTAAGFKKERELLELDTPQADTAARLFLKNQLQQDFDKTDELVQKLLKTRAEAATALKLRAGVATNEGRNTILYGILIGNLIGAAVGVFLAGRIAKLFTGVTESLGASGGQVSAASQQLSSASQKLSASTTENAAAIEETASSLEEFSSMVKQNADHAREANHLSQLARQTAEVGEGEVKELMTSIGSIVDSSKKIEEIISVIDGIAFQTNLLALNAAVEAARAGEHGKGFAVVAEAVRNLAQRSADAAKEISTLIKDNVEKSNQGSKVAFKSSESLKEIVTNVKKVSDLIAEIASASQEQSQGIEQIAKAINQVDQTTQSNAATSEQSAAASEELSAQAVLLGDMVNELATIVDGKNEAGANIKKTVQASYSKATVAKTILKPSKVVHMSAAPSVAKAQVSKTPSVKVQALKTPAVKKLRSEDIIPFDGDDEGGNASTEKLGNVANF